MNIVLFFFFTYDKKSWTQKHEFWYIISFGEYLGLDSIISRGSKHASSAY